MLTLFFIGLLFGFPDAGVRLDAYLPAQYRVVMGRITGAGDEVVVITEGRLFVGLSTRLAIARNRAYIEAEGEQDGIPAIALIECEDGTPQGKIDRMQVAVLQEIGEGDFGFPGRPLPCYPTRQGGDAVQIFGGGK